MPTKDRSEIGGLFFGSTGEKLTDISDVDIVTECESDAPRYLFGGEISCSFEIHEPIIDEQLLNLADPTYEIGYNTKVQKRKHHKRRINKKWLKQYGCKLVYHSLGKFKKRIHSDGSFSFVRDCYEDNFRSH